MLPETEGAMEAERLVKVYTIEVPLEELETEKRNVPQMRRDLHGTQDSLCLDRAHLLEYQRS